MQLGMMNNPVVDPYKEIAWVGGNGLDFIDLSLEPPHAMPEQLSASKVRALLSRHKIGVVGHTYWGLPFNSPYPSLREASFQEFMKSLDFFAQTGAKKMNIHLLRNHPHLFSQAFPWMRDFLKRLLREAEKRDVTLMIENLEVPQTQLFLLARLLRALPGLGLHLDVGHANLKTGENKTEWLLKRFSKRLEHVHLSDNDGTEDQHLPFGAGRGAGIDWAHVIKLLKKHKYDRTITLEVFSQDRDY